MRPARGWWLLAAAVAAVSGGCVCLDLDQPRRYRCTADTECMGGWRCGTDHFCVDPSGDALQPNASAPAVSVAQLTPADPPGLPDLVSTTQDSAQFDSSCADAGLRNTRWTAEPVLAQVRGDAVTVTAVWPDGREALPDGGLPNGPECAAFAAPPRYQDRFTGSLGGRKALDVAQVGGTTYVLTENGGLCAFTFAPGQDALSGGCKDGTFTFKPTRLRTNPGDRAYMLAHSSSAYALYSLGDGGVSATASVTLSGGRPMPITEMIMSGTGGPDYELLTAINDAGLFVSSLARYRYEPDGGGTPPFGFWEPVQTQEVGCVRNPTWGGFGPPQSMRLVYDYYNSVSSDPVLAIHVLDDNPLGGSVPAEDHTLFYRATNDAGTWGAPCVPLPTPASYPAFPSTRLYYTHAFADCRPCQPDHSLRDWRLGLQYPEGGGNPTLVMEARCLPRDGGTLEAVNVITDVATACDPFGPTLPDIARYARPSRWDRSDGYSQAFANDLGHLYGAGFVAGLALPALTMDRTPSVLVQTASGLSGAVQAELIGDPFEHSREQLIAREVFREGPTGYAGTGNDNLPAFSSIAGQPTWAIIGDETESLYMVAENTTRPSGGEQIPLRILAHFNGAVAVQQPFLGAAVRNPLGREVLMVATNDALTAVDVTDLADHPDAGGFDEPSYFASPELDVRAVPLPRTPITSLVPIPPDPDAGTPLFAEAFLVQGGRVFKVTAFNHTYWKVDELDLGGAEVIAVVADGRRGRAGTKDGKVYALPSRVLVADGLGAAAPVLDYAQAGSTTFAVAQGGLYRLRADGASPLGTWEQVMVTPMPPDERGFQSARLFSISDQLLLFLHGGWGYRISGGR
jgi:hypothetical protein